MNKQLVINGRLVAYIEVGEPAGKDILLFLHGWRSSKESWTGVVSGINDGNARHLALDLPGFGESEVPTRPFGVGEYAEIVAAFIRKMDLGRVVVVGHSFGGRVGIRLAASYPNLVAKLVLVDSAGFSANAAKKKIFGIMAKVVRPVFKLSILQGLRKKIYQAIGAEDYLATPHLQQTFVKLVNEDLSADMEKICCPTLLVWGSKDADTPISYAEKMRKKISGSRLEVIEGAGHYSFLDKPEEFLRLLKEFIQS